MQLSVVRNELSPYLGNDFLSEERRMVEDLGLKYYYQETPHAGPWILFTNTHTQLEDIEDSNLKSLELVLHPNSGYDNFSPNIIEKIDSPIIVGNPIRAHGVANYILSSVLQHYSPIPHNSLWNQGRDYERSLLNEKNALIIGYGHIGKIIHQSLKPLCSSIQIYDPFKGFNQIDYEKADLILLCASLNPSSKNFIDKSFLSKLPKDYLLVNAARGKLVNQSELINSLQNNPNAFAILDVFEEEPFESEQFENIGNIKLTSHIAGVSTNLSKNILDFEQVVLKDFLKNYENINIFQHQYKDLILKNRYQQGFLI